MENGILSGVAELRVYRIINPVSGQLSGSAPSGVTR
jgi:hypothetical protein